MRKDITKKFLGKENRYAKKMLSKEIVAFISRNKINVDAEQIGYDVVEFRNVFSTEFIELNINNFVGLKNIIEKNDKRIEFNMIYCVEGTFIMGSNVPADNNPQKKAVITTPFLLGETEVTQELYELVMGYNPSYFQGVGDSSKRPVEKVTWYDAIMFCNKLSVLSGKNPYYKITNETKERDRRSKVVYIAKADISINEGANGFRLPLEQEWEYAARAGTNNLYAGTNEDSRLEEYAWFGESSRNGSTHPVATKKPNEWGFYDMSGNVGEWCGDKSQSQFYVSRGGGWISCAPSLNSTYRSLGSPSNHDNNTGFRVLAYL